MANHVHFILIIVLYMLLNVTLILFHVSLFFSTIVIISIGRKYFFINHCGVTTCGQTDQEPVKLSKASEALPKWLGATRFESSCQIGL